MASAAKVVKLVLNNFKSYQGQVTVGPFLDFTCIVGPNGSGKSNLMDALSFVLGNSNQTLRAEKLEDFINKNAKKKECSVSLVVRLPSGQERKLSRIVNARGQSTVAIDDTHVSDAEFRAALTKLRIGQRLSTFLVFQHEVDAVAQKKAKEYTDLIEEVSGSAELKAEYVAKRKALEAANEQLANASTDKRGAMAEVHQMRLHKKEAEKYEQFAKRLAEERRDLALTELFHIETQLAKQKGHLEKHRVEVARLNEIVSAAGDAAKTKKEYADKHKAYLELLKASRDINMKAREKRSTLERIEASIEHFQKKLARDEADLKAAQQSKDARSTETKRLEDQLTAQEKLLASLEEKWKKEDKETHRHNLVPAQLQEYQGLRKEADCQSITKRQELDTLRRNRDTLQQALKQAQGQAENFEAAAKDLAQNVARTKQAIDDLKKRLEDARSEEKAKDKELTDARTALQQTQGKAQSRQEELARVDAQLRELRSVREVSKQDRKLGEALTALKSMHSGIRGRLVDLCTIPNQAKYRNAVTVAMGKHLEAVVVDTAETALACVRYLKDQRVGTMSFIPLGNATGAGVDDSLRTFGGTCKPIVDVIKYDPSIEPAVRFALGQTLVCDDMDEARRVAYGQPDGSRHKVVTIQGNTLMKNGAIQGGLAAVESRAKKWDEKHYDSLAQLREGLINDASSEAADQRLQSSAQQLATTVETLKARCGRISDELKRTQARLQKLEADARNAEEQRVAHIKRGKDIQAQVQALETEMIGIQKAIGAIEAKVFGDFQKRVGIDNIADIEEKAAQEAKARSEKRAQLQVTIHKLKAAIDTEAKRIGMQVPEELEKAVAQTRKDMATNQKELTDYKKISDEWQRKMQASADALAAAKTEMDQLEGSLRRISKSNEADVQRLAAARKSVTMLQSACDALRQQRLSLFQRCRLEEINLPTVAAADGKGKRPRRTDAPRDSDEDDESTNPLLLRISEAFTSFSEASGKKVSHADELCIDFSSLPAELRKGALDSGKFAAFKTRTEQIVEQLERDLESLAPNLKASNRFTASEAKLGTSSEEVEAAREKARKALVEFTTVKELRVQRFMAAFERVSENLQKVYRELTLGTRAHDVHGTAYLSLDDQEEPYNGGVRFHATPPMKRFMTIDLLSGGERTMAALALLFAIHSISPTPFFVLDEVDAALDIGNVQKLATYMRRHATDCQFLVVSLKDQLYHIADSLVGVYKDHTRESSGTLSLDLRTVA